MTRWAVVLDPLGMANVVSDREPGPGVALDGLTGAWERMTEFTVFDDAVHIARRRNEWNKPARDCPERRAVLAGRLRAIADGGQP